MTIVKQKIEVQSEKPTYVKYTEAKPGQTLVVGNLTEIRMVDNFNKDGKVPSFVFQTDTGTTILNSATDLNKQLEQVEIGSAVEVVFLGAEKLKNKKGQPYKLNKFEVSLLQEV